MACHPSMPGSMFCSGHPEKLTRKMEISNRIEIEVDKANEEILDDKKTFQDIEEEIRQMLAEDEANDGNLPNP